ncbi:PilZ domain-containing protein [Candidatus Omnitrophota bacterium]
MQRRKYRRIDAELLVEYSLEGKPSRKAKLKTYTKNVGARGMCFSVDEDIALNTTLSLKIYPAEKAEPIAALAKIVWKGKFTDMHEVVRYDVGVDIVEIGERDQKRLRQRLFELVDEGGAQA